MLSGQDYPLKSNEAFHSFLTTNHGKAFMEFYDVFTEWKEAIPRIQKYFLTEFHFKGKHIGEEILNKLLPHKKMPYNLVPVGRSQWFSITTKQANYILEYVEQHPKLIRFFKLTWGSDEIFFQTILFNSAYKKDMVNDNLRMIDWSEGKANPKIFTIKDAESLIHSNKFFARKFNIQTDSSILDYLDEHALK